jgi:hypothetical protein
MKIYCAHAKKEHVTGYTEYGTVPFLKCSTCLAFWEEASPEPEVVIAYIKKESRTK